MRDARANHDDWGFRRRPRHVQDALAFSVSDFDRRCQLRWDEERAQTERRRKRREMENLFAAPEDSNKVVPVSADEDGRSASPLLSRVNSVAPSSLSSKNYRRFLSCLTIKHIEGNIESMTREGKASVVKKHWSVMLFLDISGFTRLSQKLGAEKTEKHCSIYFTKILDVVTRHLGDVYKFLGDAVMVIWPLESDASESRMRSACLAAAYCARDIMRVGKYDDIDFNIDTGDEVNVCLRLHCGMACGKMMFYILRDEECVDTIIGGDVLPRLAQCETEAKRNEIVMSSECAEHLLKIDESLGYDLIPTKSKKNVLLKWKTHDLEFEAYDDVRRPGRCFFPFYTKITPGVMQRDETRRTRPPVQKCKRQSYALNLSLNRALLECSICADEVAMLGVGNVETSDLDQREILREALQGMALRAIDGDVVAYSGEMRKVTTVFFCLDDLIPAISKGDAVLVHKTFSMISNIIKLRGGLIRQFVQDDKGCVLIAAFGPQQHTFIDNDARALRCTLNVIDRLKTSVGIKCSAGLATGDVYCGFVGGDRRSEWAMLGPSVNLAARLMGKAKRGHCIVDNAACMSILNQTSDFEFRQIPSVRAKGYKDPVLVYVPNIRGQGLIHEKISSKESRKGKMSLRRRLSMTLFKPRILRSPCTDDKANLTRVQALQKVNDLDDFETLVLKVFSVVGCDYDELCVQKHTNYGMRKTTFVKLFWAGADSDLLKKSIDSDRDTIISLSTVVFVLASLGYTDQQRIQDVLLKLQRPPSLIRFAKRGIKREQSKTKPNESTSRVSETSVLAISGVLKEHYLFKRMNAGAIRSVAQKFRRVAVKPGKTLYSMGDASDGYFYVIESGTFDIIVLDEEKTTLGSGQYFGDVALLYKCNRSMTVVASPNNSDTIKLWALSSVEFSKVKRLRFVFADSNVRRAVYRRILSGQLKTLHSLVASFYVDQKRRRNALIKRFADKANALKAIVMWSSTRNINVSNAMESTPEQDSRNILTDSVHSKVLLSRGYSMSEGDKSKSHETPTERLRRKLKIRQIQGTFLGQQVPLSKRRTRRLSDYVNHMMSSEDENLVKDDRGEALALVYAGGISSHMRRVQNVNTALSISALLFATKLKRATSKLPTVNSGCEESTLSKSRNISDDSSNDMDDTLFSHDVDSSTGAKESDVETNTTRSRIQTKTFSSAETMRKNEVLSTRSKNESFLGGGLSERMCGHLLLSRFNPSIVLGEMLSVALTALGNCEYAIATRFFNEVIARMVDQDGAPLVLRHFVRLDEKAIRTYRTQNKEYSKRACKARWTTDRVTGTYLHAGQIRTLPVKSKMLKHLCDGFEMRRKAMRSHRLSRHGNAFKTGKTTTPTTSTKRESHRVPLQHIDKPAHMAIAKYLRILADTYRRCGEQVLAFNACQVALLYLSFPTISLSSSQMFFSWITFGSKRTSDISKIDDANWNHSEWRQSRLLGGIAIYETIRRVCESKPKMQKHVKDLIDALKKRIHS